MERSHEGGECDQLAGDRGIREEPTLVEVDTLLTVCETGADVLVRKLLLPA